MAPPRKTARFVKKNHSPPASEQPKKKTYINFLCNKCGKTDRHLNSEWDGGFNEFRAHLNEEGTERCLEKDCYKERHDVWDDRSSIYVMFEK